MVNFIFSKVTSITIVHKAKQSVFNKLIDCMENGMKQLEILRLIMMIIDKYPSDTLMI